MLGTKILEDRNSPINGKIRVVKDLAWGTHIQAEGLTQSGGVVESIWRSTLKNLRTKKLKNCLILGLGGGTAAKLVRKFWPEAKIVGVEVDLIMVELGKKYMGLEEIEVEIKIGDAQAIINQLSTINKEFDLILVDLYVGDKVPEKFKSDEFLELVLRLLTDNGTAVFNRLYYGEKRPEAMKFGKKLEKVFPKVEYFYPEANLMLLCYNR